MYESPPMRRMVFAVLMAACPYGPARAGDAIVPADRAAINHVITAQIQAFRHNDGIAAFQFAAPNIQRKFGDGARFLEIVREAYPPVFRPRSFSFGDLTSEGGLVTQKVEIVGPDGKAALALYDMEHEPDGSWRISGCSLVKGEQRET